MVEEIEPYQEDVLNSVKNNPKTAFRSGHGVGKTALASWCVNWFFDCFPNSKVITTASSWRQVEKMLWSEIPRWRNKANLELIGIYREDWEALSLMLKRHGYSDWFATGEASDDNEKMEGFHAENIFYVVDEGKAVPDKTYESIEGAMTNVTGTVRELVISTPPAEKTGYFYEIFAGKRVGFNKFHISSEDSKRVSKGWIAEREKEWGRDSPMFITRVLGEFADAGENTLIPLSWVERCINKDVPTGRKVLGLDVARYGEDKTVLTRRNGNKVISQTVTSKEDTMETTGKAKRVYQDEGYELINVDVIGVGSGVVDRLKEQSINVVGINNADKASDGERFKNFRAESYWGMRERFKDGDISIPDDEELVAQLTAIKYRYNSRGQLEIESKEDMKKRGIRSPDKADSLVLAFCEVKKIEPNLWVY
jgi:hypothetical protein